MSRDDAELAERIASEPTATRHDLVLAVVPLALVAGLLAGVLAGVGARTGVSVGSLVALLAVGYGVFGDPPVGRGGGKSAS